MEIIFKTKSWDVRLVKQSVPRSHSYFCWYNFNPKEQKTFDNNTLEQGKDIVLLKGYVISIKRVRLFSEVSNIHKFLEREEYRIGSWS